MHRPLQCGLRRRNRRRLLNDNMRIRAAKAKGADTAPPRTADLRPRSRFGRNDDGKFVPRNMGVRIGEVQTWSYLLVLERKYKFHQPDNARGCFEMPKV